MIEAYCHKCKKKTEMVNAEKREKNNTNFYAGNCIICGGKTIKLLGKIKTETAETNVNSQGDNLNLGNHKVIQRSEAIYPPDIPVSQINQEREERWNERLANSGRKLIKIDEEKSIKNENIFWKTISIVFIIALFIFLFLIYTGALQTNVSLNQTITPEFNNEVKNNYNLTATSNINNSYSIINNNYNSIYINGSIAEQIAKEVISIINQTKLNSTNSS